MPPMWSPGFFSRYSARPDLMPQEWQAQVAERETAGQARIIADYIAGMTDRYAYEEFQRATAKS